MKPYLSAIMCTRATKFLTLKGASSIAEVLRTSLISTSSCVTLIYIENNNVATYAPFDIQ